jgi:hypothetical protein
MLLAATGAAAASTAPAKPTTAHDDDSKEALQDFESGLTAATRALAHEHGRAPTSKSARPKVKPANSSAQYTDKQSANATPTLPEGLVPLLCVYGGRTTWLVVCV